MKFHYLKIAWRNLSKRKANTLINVFGLSTGMAVCILLLLFINDEKSFDGSHENKDRIFRVALERIYPGRSTFYSFIPASIGEAINTEFPEVKESTRLFNNGDGNTYFKVGDVIFEEKNVLLADSNFFRVFSGTALAGNLQTALDKPNNIVLNESTAKKLFGSVKSAMGNTVKIEEQPYTVSGICKDWPENSHVDFSVLMSSNTFFQNAPKNYINFSAHTYLLLKENSSSQALEAKLPLIIEKYVSKDIEKLFGQTFTQFKSAGNGYRYFLQPLTGIHLSSNLEGELKPNGNEKAVSIFLLIAIFILVIACINFINLSTARSAERAREVGIRKTFGSERRSLISQFLFESVLISLISMVIALVMVVALMPAYNNLTAKHLSLSTIITPLYLLYMVIMALVIGVIAGIYPAFVLSSFKPIFVLKGRLQTSRHGIGLRNSLVVFQFGISVILIICTLIVNQQMEYVTGNSLGFKKDLVLTIERTDLLDKNTDAFKDEVLKIAGVQTISGASALPGTNNYFGVSFQNAGTKESYTGRALMADNNYLQALSLQLDKGRFFSKTYSTDTFSLILNESAVNAMGIKGNPVGARLTTPDEDLNAHDGSQYIYTVVGVVKDFHFQNLHEKIAPLFMIHVRKFTQNDPLMVVKLDAANYPAAINSIEKVWKKFIGEIPFHYTFLDQNLARMYAAEVTTRKVFTVFSVLAIIIACMGLLGLISYTIQLRIKEIGIRKVLGASVSQILWLLGKNFFKVIIFAGLIAIPVSIILMTKWLQGFEYRVNMSPWVFIIALLSAVIIASITIGFQAVKAAWSNPVKSLRTE
jgi:putative ABC transport system permease protein